MQEKKMHSMTRFPKTVLSEPLFKNTHKLKSEKMNQKGMFSEIQNKEANLYVLSGMLLVIYKKKNCVNDGEAIMYVSACWLQWIL